MGFSSPSHSFVLNTSCARRLFFCTMLVHLYGLFICIASLLAYSLINSLFRFSLHIGQQLAHIADILIYTYIYYIGIMICPTGEKSVSTQCQRMLVFMRIYTNIEHMDRSVCVGHFKRILCDDSWECRAPVVGPKRLIIFREAHVEYSKREWRWLQFLYSLISRISRFPKKFQRKTMLFWLKACFSRHSRFRLCYTRIQYIDKRLKATFL